MNPGDEDCVDLTTEAFTLVHARRASTFGAADRSSSLLQRPNAASSAIASGSKGPRSELLARQDAEDSIESIEPGLTPSGPSDRSTSIKRPTPSSGSASHRLPLLVMNSSSSVASKPAHRDRATSDAVAAPAAAPPNRLSMISAAASAQAPAAAASSSSSAKAPNADLTAKAAELQRSLVHTNGELAKVDSQIEELQRKRLLLENYKTGVQNQLNGIQQSMDAADFAKLAASDHWTQDKFEWSAHVNDIRMNKFGIKGYLTGIRK